MPKVSDEHREARRRQILTAAKRSFVRRGIQETSMSDIIAESGLSAGAIYGHFAGKAEIIAAVATEVLVDGREAMALTRDDDGAPMHPLDFVGRLSDALLGRIGRPGLAVQVWGRAAVDPEVRALFDTVFPELIGSVADQTAFWLHEVKGMPEAAARTRAVALAPVIVGVLQGAVLQTEFVAGFDRPAYLALARPLVEAP